MLEARGLLTPGLLGEQTRRLVGIGDRRGHGLVHMAAPPATDEVERMEHIDHRSGVDVAYELDDVLALIGRYDGVKQVHPVAAVAAHHLGAADAVLEVVDVRGHDLVGHARGDLEGHAVVAVIEAVDGLGGDELEHNRIRGVVPAEHPAKDDQDKAVEGEDDAPDGLARVIGDPQGDEVGAARRGARLEGDRAALHSDPSGGDRQDHESTDCTWGRSGEWKYHSESKGHDSDSGSVVRIGISPCQ